MGIDFAHETKRGHQVVYKNISHQLNAFGHLPLKDILVNDNSVYKTMNSKCKIQTWIDLIHLYYNNKALFTTYKTVFVKGLWDTYNVIITDIDATLYRTCHERETYETYVCSLTQQEWALMYL